MTIFILVVLPMSKNAFIAAEEGYIESVAATASVIKENVKVLSVDEISTRASKAITLRMLLGTSVSVNTSVILASGQQTNIQDQSVLNENLVKNGLPFGTLTVQFTTTSAGLVTASSPSTAISTPAPYAGGSGSQATSNVPLVASVGGAAGGLVLVICGFFVCRKKNVQPKNPFYSCLNASLVSQVSVFILIHIGI